MATKASRSAARLMISPAVLLAAWVDVGAVVHDDLLSRSSTTTCCNPVRELLLVGKTIIGSSPIPVSRLPS